MAPRRIPHRSSPCPAAQTGGDAQKGETATSAGRFTLPAIVACLALLPLLAAGCGGDEAPAAKEGVRVKIASFKFAPEAVKVRRGGTVVFANADKAPHTAQTDLDARAAEFDTKRLELGDEQSVRLDKPGKFQYFCVYHRFMEGTVEVVE